MPSRTLGCTLAPKERMIASAMDVPAWIGLYCRSGPSKPRQPAFETHGQTPPGFNHPLYPKGDPRAELLLELASSLVRGKAKETANLHHFLAHARRKLHLHPRVELGVVALCRALKLPRGIPSALFAIAGTAGTVAHVIEQRSAGFLLRPRARFISNSGQ